MAIGLAENQGFLLVSKEDAVSPTNPAGTYKPPAAGDAVQILSDGLEFTPAQEIIDRDIRSATIEQTVGRTTTRSITGTVPVELRANTQEGGAPEADKFYESLLGGRRQRTSTTLKTAASQTGVSNRKRTFAVAASDTAEFKVGDAVRIFKLAPNAIDFISVVKSVNATTNQITLVNDAPIDIPGTADISPCTTYFVNPNQAARFLSLTQYLGAKLEERAMGCRGTTGEITNFTTGQLPMFNFGFEGLDFDRRVPTPQQLNAANDLTTYQQSLPPIILSAKVFQDDMELTLNSVTINFTNTLGFITSTASERGRLTSRVTDFDCTMTLNPYQDDANVKGFELFKQNNSFSVFGHASNKDASGKLNQICTFYAPNCRVQEIATGSEDGILTDELNCRAYLQNGNDTIFMSFI